MAAERRSLAVGTDENDALVSPKSIRGCCCCCDDDDNDGDNDDDGCLSSLCSPCCLLVRSMSSLSLSGWKESSQGSDEDSAVACIFYFILRESEGTRTVRVERKKKEKKKTNAL